MSIADKLITIAENEQKVYESGKATERSAFWDVFQDYGNRTDYNYAFTYWMSEYIHPKYKVIPTANAALRQIFQYCKTLKKLEKDYFDFSKTPQNLNQTGATYGYYFTFNSCLSLEEIEDIGLIPQNAYTQTFAYDGSLHTIAKLGVAETTTFDRTFGSCKELQNITIDGTIGQSGFDIHWSKNLTAKSLKSIVDALSTTTSGLSITFPTTAEANYNANPPEGAPQTWAELVATRSNWTFVYA